MLAPAPNHTPDGPASVLLVKAVPGASRDQIAGVLDLPGGKRLKVRIAAPPESGKANKAICKLLAEALGLGARDATIAAGPTNPLKTIHIRGLGPDDVRARLDAGPTRPGATA